MLDHYWNIWKDYDAKYQTLSFVQVLENKMKEFSITEAHLKDKKQEKQELITNFVNLQGNFHSLLSIANVRISIFQFYLIHFIHLFFFMKSLNSIFKETISNF